MKKFIFSIVFVVLSFFIFSQTKAIDLGGGFVKKAAGVAGYSEQTGETTLAETIGTIVQAALSLIGIVFVTLMVYAGFLWMTARGEQEKVDKAKDIIKASIIGLIITLGAYSITAFIVPRVLERTGGQGTSYLGNSLVLEEKN